MQSSTNPDRTYTVTPEAEACPFNCSLMCYNCGVCIHMYCCTCTDALVLGTICKHIHLVIRSEGTGKREMIQPNHSENAQTSSMVLKTIQNKARLGGLENLKNKLLSKVSEISAGIHDLHDVDTLSTISKHLNSCVSLLTIGASSREPSNKRILQQRPFYSTKMKKSRPRTRLAKPSDQEKQTVTENLLKFGPAQKLPQGIQQSTICELMALSVDYTYVPMCCTYFL